MSCFSCGNARIDAIVNKLPDQLSPTIFNQILMEAPKVFDDKIGLQPDTSRSLFLSLLTKKPFPVDQSEYSEIRITKSSGLQFYDNNEVFRKLNDPDGCVPGCQWQPRSFSAGNEIFSSSMLVADFEQEIPCYDNMYKKYAFLQFFAQVPMLLNTYMEGVMASFTRNELLSRAKKLVLTSETFRSRTCDSTEWPNVTSLLVNGNFPTWDLSLQVLLTIWDEKVRLHPDVPGLGSVGGNKVLGLMMEPLQWRLKVQNDPLYGDYIRRNPSMSSDFFTKFNTFETFADSITFIPSGPDDLPRADIDTNGDIVYHYSTIDVPAGNNGVKRIGNPAFNNARFGVALLVNGDIGHLWDEMPIPNQSLPGGVKLGPNFGATQMSNGKWVYLPAYDYNCNPLGKGGKWIAQYKTGFHAGRGIEGLYAILYPLTKYEHEKTQLLVSCGVDPVVCTDGYQESCNVCPGFISCCNITSTRAVLKFDGDTGYAEEDVMPLISKGQVLINATVDEVTVDEGAYVYIVTLASAIDCACIQGVQCPTPVVSCAYDIVASTDCYTTAPASPLRIGLKAKCPINDEVATVLTALLANGTTIDLTVQGNEVINGIGYTFFTGAAGFINTICAAGGVVRLTSQDAVACPDANLVIPCSELEAPLVLSAEANAASYEQEDAISIEVTFDQAVTAGTPGALEVTWTGAGGDYDLALVAQVVADNTIVYTGTIPAEAGTLSVGAQTLTGTVLDEYGNAANLTLSAAQATAIGSFIVA